MYSPSPFLTFLFTIVVEYEVRAHYRPSRPQTRTQPVRVDLRKAFGIGTGLWAVALVIA